MLRPLSFHCLKLAVLFFALLCVPALAAEPARIVSLGGGITEVLYRLGLGQRLVGVDATSVYPPDALATRPNVGYLRNLGAEGILSLKPDLILADHSAGPPATLALLQQSGVKVVTIPEGRVPEDVERRIVAVAAATGHPEKAAALIAEVRDNLARIATAKRTQPDQKRVLFVLSLANGRVIVGGSNTNIDHLLTLIGASNAAAAVEGWKPLSEEGIITAAPDTVIMMRNGPGGPPPDIFALPAFAATPAARTAAFLRVDGASLLNFGPRTPVAALELLHALNQTEATGPGGPTAGNR